MFPVDPLDHCSPEQVVDLLMPADAGWGDREFDAFVADLDYIRDVNAWWLILSPDMVRRFVESAEVY